MKLLHAFVLFLSVKTYSFVPQLQRTFLQRSAATTALLMTESDPQTFREAEVLGLKLMQDGNYKDALDGM
jgi:hypothetical protein